MTTALYRRYRPETFQDVIGQSHVTDPLMTALRKDKVSHAYLFSGPRGCGKTTSARILARCLNCAQGPTPTPCGECASCQDLARDGAGSLDVIEMDAASHGGVDDARQLRERATFAPVRDRFKIFIIDEAHMVTRDGFNALLKIVEEPPEHIKFIFATTEPNKVLPTIRSRTHHYPFRLVPPEPLMDYLTQLCEQEGVGVEPGVQAMVVRAGGGSVRDSLSVLDQLMAGTDDDHIGYDLASSLLGYTHGALLDDVVDAFASGDAATVFRAVDRVIQTGQDPRRFVEDLLERFRDLVIVDAVPDSAGNILHGTPEDQIARLRNQAQLMGAAELSRAADITNEALTEMVGATSPQLHLELLCARLLLPSAENTTRGVAVRVDRLERRLSIGRTGAPTGPMLEVPAEPSAAPSPTTSADSPQQVPAAEQTRRPAPAPSDAGQSQGTAQDDQDRGAEPSAAQEPREQQEHQGPPERSQPAPDHQPASDRQSEEDPDPLAAAQGGFGKFRGQGPSAQGQAPASASASAPSESAARDEQSADRAPAQDSAPTRDHTPERPPRASPERAQGPASGGQIDMIRNAWTEVLSALAEIHRVSWMTVMRGTPVAFDGSVLQLVFEAEGDRKNFPRFEPNLVQAIQDVIGVPCRVEAVAPGGGSGPGHGGPGGGTGPGGGAGGTGPRGGTGPSSSPDPRGSAGSGSGPSPRGGAGSNGSAGPNGDAGPSRGYGDARGMAQGSAPAPATASSSAPARSSAPAHPGSDQARREPSAPESSEQATTRAQPDQPDSQDQRDRGGQQDRSGQRERPAGRQDAPQDAARRQRSGPDPAAAQQSAVGGRETGPRSFPESSAASDPSAASGEPSSPGAPDAAGGTGPVSTAGTARPSSTAEAPDSSEEVTTWEVARIPTGENPAEDSSPDQQSQPSAPAAPAAASQPVAPAAASQQTGGQQEYAEGPRTPRPQENDETQEPARNQEPARPQAPEPSRQPPRGRAPEQAPRSTPPRSRPAQPRRGEDPAPDQHVPASPYDDIPWPDEPPPEDEPPFEDTGYRSPAASPRRPSPAPAPASASAPPSSPAAPAPPSSSDSASASEPNAPRTTDAPAAAEQAGAQAPSASAGKRSSFQDAPEPPEAQASVPSPSDGEEAPAAAPAPASAPAEEAPPEQWRPSSSSKQAAAPERSRPLSFRERHAAAIAQARASTAPAQPQQAGPGPDLEAEGTFAPSEDDEAIENSSMSGRAVIERILGARLLEEIPREPGGL